MEKQRFENGRNMRPLMKQIPDNKWKQYSDLHVILLFIVLQNIYLLSSGNLWREPLLEPTQKPLNHIRVSGTVRQTV